MRKTSLQQAEAISVNDLVRPNIRTLQPYRCAREEVQEGILLDANESPFSQFWAGVRLNRYPDPSQRKLRKMLANYLGVPMENLAAGSGSDEVLDWIFKVFCQPGQDSVSVAEPTYGMYSVLASIFDVSVFRFPLDQAFNFSASEFLMAVPSKVKVLFLCSPNNPTGNLLEQKQILAVCRKWLKIVVVDEAYIEFSQSRSLATEVVYHPNLIVLRTLSKALGRAGLRIGYAVASKEIISYFLKVKAPYNLSSVSAEKGCQVLSCWHDRVPEWKQIRNERDRVRRSLGQIEGVTMVFPSNANFLLFRCRKATQVCRRLLEKGIVVRDRSTLPGLKDCIRVSIGTSWENDSFLQGLKATIRKDSND